MHVKSALFEAKVGKLLAGGFGQEGN